MEIKKVEYKDAIEIKQLLVNSPSIVNSSKLLPEVLEHIDMEGCIASKIVNEDKIVGVWLSKEFDEYVSLSYFYIDPSIRMKHIVLDFFVYNYNMVKDSRKNIVIAAKDITGFERYVIPVDDELYVFKGFR